MYQWAMDEMLEGIDHAFVVMDDILIAGRDTTHHDSVLEKVLDRARGYNVKRNFEKVYKGQNISVTSFRPRH